MRDAVDDHLCSVELHAPQQERKEKQFSLFAVLNFDIKTEENTISKNAWTVRYGFHAAEVRLKLKECDIAPVDRYHRSLPTREIKKERHHEDAREGGVEGLVKAGIPEFFALLSLGGKASASRRSVVKTVVTETDTIKIDCDVVARHGKYWRIYGTENEEGVLLGQLLGDVPLCQIIPGSGDQCRVDAAVHADLRDLWLTLEHERQDEAIIDANRKAVCTALIAKTLRSRGRAVEGAISRGEVRLAVDSLVVHARQMGEQSSDYLV
ncbi:MAG: hypothetical protein WA840_06255 [Caulobacteraceae bacterium]